MTSTDTLGRIGRRTIPLTCGGEIRLLRVVHDDTLGRMPLHGCQAKPAPGGEVLRRRRGGCDAISPPGGGVCGLHRVIIPLLWRGGRRSLTGWL